MREEYVTNGGKWVEKNHLGQWSIKGQRVTDMQLQEYVKTWGGGLQKLKGADKKTKDFAEMTREGEKKKAGQIEEYL